MVEKKKGRRETEIQMARQDRQTRTRRKGSNEGKKVG